MTLFWHPTGALLKYENGFLYVENLNPDIETRWRMSSFELLMLSGFMLLVAEFFARLVSFGRR